MNPDIRLPIGFFGSIKVKRLSRACGADGVVSLQKLWMHAAQHHHDGVLADMTPQDIEDAGEWTGKGGAFFAALRDLGWIDRVSRASWKLHEWAEHQPFVVSQPLRTHEARRKAHLRHHANKEISVPESCTFCADSIHTAMPAALQPVLPAQCSDSVTDSVTDSDSDSDRSSGNIETFPVRARRRGKHDEKLPSVARVDFVLELARQFNVAAERSGILAGDPSFYASEFHKAVGYTPDGLDRLCMKVLGRPYSAEAM